jgi:hypothetical protein
MKPIELAFETHLLLNKGPRYCCKVTYCQSEIGRIGTAATTNTKSIDQNPCAHWRSPMDMIRSESDAIAAQ